MSCHVVMFYGVGMYADCGMMLVQVSTSFHFCAPSPVTWGPCIWREDSGR